MITFKNGIAAGFRQPCPSQTNRIPTWLKSIRSAIKGAKSGIQWQESRVLVPGALPTDIDITVPLTVVFDWPTPASVQVSLNKNDPLITATPPIDVLSELSSQIYSTIFPLIDYADRRLHEGCPDDDGWALLRRLRTSQSNEGTHIDYLLSVRDGLTCNGYSDYPAFKAAMLQCFRGWNASVTNGLITADEAWSLRQAKRFVGDLLHPLFGAELQDFIDDPAHQALTLDQIFMKVSTMYCVRVRNLRKRKASDTNLLLEADPEPQPHDVSDDADHLEAYYSQHSDKRPRQHPRPPPAASISLDDALDDALDDGVDDATAATLVATNTTAVRDPSFIPVLWQRQRRKRPWQRWPRSWPWPWQRWSRWTWVPNP